MRAIPRLWHELRLTRDCIEALSNPPTSTESIFPNLRVIGLQDPTTTIAPFVRHFLNPKLTDIWSGRLENLDAAIEGFGEKCPLVTDFCVLELAHAGTISDLICRWQHLCSVKCYSICLNMNALSHLSRLRNIHHLSFKVHDAVVDRISATQSFSSTLSFSAFRDLYIASDSLTPVWRLFHHFRTPAIHRLSVMLYVHACPTPSDLVSFFVALQQTCAHHASLNELSLRVYRNRIRSDAIAFTVDRLRPLTVFVNIKSIVLNMPCGMDLNERELLCLASSWPHLEIFEVGKNYDWTPSSALTPGGFLQLLERCRSLRVLYFMLDVRGYTEIPQGHPWRGLSMPKGTLLHFLNSPIEEESIKALGVFFHVAPYPDFGLSTHWNERFFSGSERPQELCELYHNRWVEARSLARDLWEERRNLRRSLEGQSGWRDSQ